MTIWKFPFGIREEFDIGMPEGAKILHVELQGGEPHMWALVNPLSRREMRRFYVFGTGHTIHEKAGAHIGTLVFPGVDLVFHVFEEVAL